MATMERGASEEAVPLAGGGSEEAVPMERGGSEETVARGRSGSEEAVTAVKTKKWIREETPAERTIRLEGYKLWWKREVLTNPLHRLTKRIKAKVKIGISHMSLSADTYC